MDEELTVNLKDPSDGLPTSPGPISPSVCSPDIFKPQSYKVTPIPDFIGWYHCIHICECMDNKNLNMDKVRKLFNYIKESGAVGLRTDVMWYDVEPSENCWDKRMMEIYNTYFAEAKAKGLDSILIFSNAPGWAVSLHKASIESFYSRYKVYVEKVYQEIGIPNNIRFYQLWNEPNSTFHNKVYDPKTNYRLYTVAGEVLKKDKNVKTMMNINADLGKWKQGINELLSKSKDYIDIIGIDHYPGTWKYITKVNLEKQWPELTYLIEQINDEKSDWYGKQGAI
jgi:hypothetical protein